VRLDDAARVGVERDLRFVPGFDLVQLVLVEERKDLVLGVDEGHHLGTHAADEEARPSITLTIVPLPAPRRSSG
jgi:hypothetical protein